MVKEKAAPNLRSVTTESYIICRAEKELRQQEKAFRRTVTREVILTAYLHYGKEFVKAAGWYFSFAIWDGRLEKNFTFTGDRAGVKPCFIP